MGRLLRGAAPGRGAAGCADLRPPGGRWRVSPCAGDMESLSESRTFCPHSGRAAKTGTNQSPPPPRRDTSRARPRLLKCHKANGVPGGARGTPHTPRQGLGAIILSHRSGEDRGVVREQRRPSLELRLRTASGVPPSPGSSLPSSLGRVGKEPVQAAPHYRGGQGQPPALRVMWAHAQQTALQPPLVLQASPAPARPQVLWGQQAGQSPGWG